MILSSEKRLRSIRTEATQSATHALMVMVAVQAMPSKKACNAVYTALADKQDVTAKDLEELSNCIGRLAWERARK